MSQNYGGTLLSTLRTLYFSTDYCLFITEMKSLSNDDISEQINQAHGRGTHTSLTLYVIYDCANV